MGVRALFGDLVFAEHNSPPYQHVSAQQRVFLLKSSHISLPAAHFKPREDPRDAEYNRQLKRKFL